VNLCTGCIFTVNFSPPAAQRRSQVKWLTPVGPEKNACPASAVFQCSFIRSDAADADNKATPLPPMKNARRAAAAGHKTTQRRRRPPVRRRTVIATSTQLSDFRPISITPVLSRSLERFVVRKYIYPALLQPNPTLDFRDQFTFRLSGLTTAAIVAIMHTVRSMLNNNDYVRVFDFSKAFDAVSHASLTNKLAQLAIPDSVYNWILDFFSRPRSLH